MTSTQSYVGDSAYFNVREVHESTLCLDDSDESFGYHPGTKLGICGFGFSVGAIRRHRHDSPSCLRLGSTLVHFETWRPFVDSAESAGHHPGASGATSSSSSDCCTCLLFNARAREWKECLVVSLSPFRFS